MRWVIVSNFVVSISCVLGFQKMWLAAVGLRVRINTTFPVDSR